MPRMCCIDRNKDGKISEAEAIACFDCNRDNSIGKWERVLCVSLAILTVGLIATGATFTAIYANVSDDPAPPMPPPPFPPPPLPKSPLENPF